jgi:lipid-A-disaccharide synthase
VLVSDDRYDAVAAADLALVASGTATLETALLGVPMVIVYRMNPLSYALARRLSDLNQIGMPNLIAARPVVPELVQERCRGEVIAAEPRAWRRCAPVCSRCAAVSARPAPSAGWPGSPGI